MGLHMITSPKRHPKKMHVFFPSSGFLLFLRLYFLFKVPNLLVFPEVYGCDVFFLRKKSFLGRSDFVRDPSFNEIAAWNEVVLFYLYFFKGDFRAETGLMLRNGQKTPAPANQPQHNSTMEVNKSPT